MTAPFLSSRASPNSRFPSPDGRVGIKKPNQTLALTSSHTKKSPSPPAKRGRG
jgi:hypothetical protein